MQEENDKKLKELEEKVAELENNWKRALADYRNLQKRTEEEKESLVEFISTMLFKRILPTLDNMEMLEKHIKDEGLRMINKEFKQILNEEGVVEIDTLGKPFDPETMDAIEMVADNNTNGESKNVVIEVLNKGYMLRNKLLRPARVKVGTAQKEETI